MAFMTGRDTKIFLENGIDISSYCRKASIHYDVGDITTVEITCFLGKITQADDGHTEIILTSSKPLKQGDSNEIR